MGFRSPSSLRIHLVGNICCGGELLYVARLGPHHRQPVCDVARLCGFFTRGSICRGFRRPAESHRFAGPNRCALLRRRCRGLERVAWRVVACRGRRHRQHHESAFVVVCAQGSRSAVDASSGSRLYLTTGTALLDASVESVGEVDVALRSRVELPEPYALRHCSRLSCVMSAGRGKLNVKLSGDNGSGHPHNLLSVDFEAPVWNVVTRRILGPRAVSSL